MNIKLLPLLVFTATLAFLAPSANASLILGTGTSALVGGDLTDPENDGLVNSNVNYDATFR